mmetsp:Transcript_31739/g.66768  ORF Transcript_31739/g.66768 Transcript_31739/m.66768 type:complete len:89 (+) Transcript_31739:485-751(+)
MVVGSSVATDTRLDDDSEAVVVVAAVRKEVVSAAVRNSAGRGAAFNGVARVVVVAKLAEGTKASADESRAIRQKRIVVVILCDIMVLY